MAPTALNNRLDDITVPRRHGQTNPEHILFTENLPREHGFEPLRVEGTLPADLQGTLYRNGPGLFELFGRRYGHPFEGDGAVSAIRLRDGEAYGAARIIESASLREERATGRMLYGLSTSWRQRIANIVRKHPGKNTANTNVIGWQGRLFALMEGGPPTELSVDDLSTIGATNLDGAIRAAFSAHPHEVASRRAIYNFGLSYGRDTTLDLYELPMHGNARCLGRIPLDFAPMLHDFIATDNFLVFFLSPVRIKIMRAMLQFGPLHNLMQWAPEIGTEVIIVPIDQPDQVTRFHTAPFFQWHFANGFEDEGKLVVDFVHYQNLDSMYELAGERDISPGTFQRYTIEPSRQLIQRRQISDLNCEFPRVHPDVQGKPYQTAWMCSNHGHALTRLNVHTGETATVDLGGDRYVSEPVFVPRANPDSRAHRECDGHVLALVYDGPSHRSHLAVFDGLRFEDGPLARAWFDHHIPVTFHGNWVNGH